MVDKNPHKDHLLQKVNSINVPNDLTPGPPTFVGIGAQKSGTSWIHNCIMHHPECYYPEFLSPQLNEQHKLKEHHFFDNFSCNDITPNDIDNYYDWCAKPHNKVTGEWTPSYLSDPWVPRLLKLSAPNTKIIVLLRDPVERYISGISFSQRKNKRPITNNIKENNSEIIEIDTSNLNKINRRIASDHFYRGLYNSHLLRWRRYFQPSSILVMQYEKLVKNPQKGLKAIFRHIGIDEHYQIPDEVVSQRLKFIEPSQKAIISNAQRNVLIEEYQNEVYSLAKRENDIDLDLWLNF